MIAARGAFQFIRDDEIVFDKSASKDKDYVIIEDALHSLALCTACEKTKVNTRTQSRIYSITCAIGQISGSSGSLLEVEGARH
jgi:hypothetical protein